MKYEAIYQLHFWIQFHIKMMMLQRFQLTHTLEELASSLSVPLLDPISLSPLDEAGTDFHTLYRQGA